MSRSSQPLVARHRAAALLLTLAAASTGLAACAQAETPGPTANPVATVQEIPGTDVKQITLSPEGSRRLRLATEPVAAGEAGSLVPYSAVVYDAEGTSWVFTRTAPNTFRREKVVVARIEQGRAVLTAGLSAGILVVTVGAAELIGAEAGLGG